MDAQLIKHAEITVENLKALLKERISGRSGYKVAILLMVLKAEWSIEEIARQLFSTRQQIYKLIWAVNKNGLSELRTRRRKGMEKLGA